MKKFDAIVNHQKKVLNESDYYSATIPPDIKELCDKILKVKSDVNLIGAKLREKRRRLSLKLKNDDSAVMWFHMLTRMNADYEKAEKSLNQVLDEYGQSFADY